VDVEKLLFFTFFGFFSLAFVAIVVDTWWVVALIAAIHATTATVVFGFLFFRHLDEGNEDEPAPPDVVQPESRP